MWIKVNNGRVFAQTGGQEFNAGQPSVVMLHGAGMDHTIWQQQSRYFAHHGWNVFAVDLPGHGMSMGLPLESVGSAADWLIALLDTIGLKRAALVGHSLGALIALDVAGRYGHRVEKLALLGVTPKMPVHQDLLEAAKANEPLASDFIVDWGFSKQAHLGGNIAPGLWMMGGGCRLLERAKPGVLGIDLAAANAYEDGLAAGRLVRCPTLLLLGAADRMTPVKGAAALQEGIANCCTVVVPYVGHMMMIEAPRAIVRALTEFLGNQV